MGSDTPSSAPELLIINNTLDKNETGINIVYRGGSLGIIRNTIITGSDIGIRVFPYDADITLTDYLVYDHNDYYKYDKHYRDRR